MLSCTHRFCWACLAGAAKSQVQDQCPVCRKPQLLDPSNYTVDRNLLEYLRQHFPSKRDKGSVDNKNENKISVENSFSEGWTAIEEAAAGYEHSQNPSGREVTEPGSPVADSLGSLHKKTTTDCLSPKGMDLSPFMISLQDDPPSVPTTLDGLIPEGKQSESPKPRNDDSFGWNCDLWDDIYDSFQEAGPVQYKKRAKSPTSLTDRLGDFSSKLLPFTNNDEAIRGMQSLILRSCEQRNQGDVMSQSQLHAHTVEQQPHAHTVEQQPQQPQPPINHIPTNYAPRLERGMDAWNQIARGPNSQTIWLPVQVPFDVTQHPSFQGTLQSAAQSLLVPFVLSQFLGDAGIDKSTSSTTGASTFGHPSAAEITLPQSQTDTFTHSASRTPQVFPGVHSTDTRSLSEYRQGSFPRAHNGARRNHGRLTDLENQNNLLSHSNLLNSSLQNQKWESVNKLQQLGNAPDRWKRNIPTSGTESGSRQKSLYEVDLPRGHPSIPQQLAHQSPDQDQFGEPQVSKHLCTEPGCGRSFNTRFSLKRHQKKHNGARPHSCPFEGCGRSFAEKSTLKRHVRAHTRSKVLVLMLSTAFGRYQ